MDLLNCLDYVENTFNITDDQRLLLRTLTAKSSHSFEKILEWISSVDFETADIPYTTLRLIPALYKTLLNYQIESNYVETMEDLYSQFKKTNCKVIFDGKTAINILLEAGIDLIVFKGFAMTLGYFKDEALRSMGDIDILIKKNELQRAEEILVENGWKYRYSQAQKIKFQHSYDYMNAENHGIDLHWYSLFENTEGNVDEGIWQRARLINCDSMQIKIMSPEDLILICMANGFRGLRDKNSYRDLALHVTHTELDVAWIYDIYKIIDNEENINWNVLFEEISTRGLMEVALFSIDILNSIVEGLIPRNEINKGLKKSEKFVGSHIFRLIAEGRTHGIRKENRNQIDGYLVKQNDFYSRTISTHNRYIKYFTNENGEITSLYLSYRFLSIIEQIFDITDPRTLKHCIDSCPQTGDGYLELGDGILRLKQNTKLRKYQANIDILVGNSRLEMLPGDSYEVILKVTNTSQCCWVLDEQKKRKINLGYHLLSKKDMVETRGIYSESFFSPRDGYVNFILPHQEIICKFPIYAPSEPGLYTIQLDIEHSSIAWFSENASLSPLSRSSSINRKSLFSRFSISQFLTSSENRFPKFEIDVLPNANPS